MTPLQFVVAECANHQPDGSCAGIVIGSDLSITLAIPRPRCLLAEGNRCAYFEQCVAPMAGWVTDPRRAASLQAAVVEYRKTTKQKPVAARPCPRCGEPLANRRRLCPRCASERRKATYRASQSRSRGSRLPCQQLTQKTA